MIAIIVAVAQNGVIGCHNKLIWHISEDLKYFKELTSGSVVIMGRKTYESIGRPLPNRVNVVVSRNKDLKIEGCTIVSSLEEAISLFRDKKIFIIGGGEIYRQGMDFADTLYLTRVHKEYQGDTYFPEIDPVKWKETERKDFERGVNFEYPFSFITYKNGL